MRRWDSVCVNTGTLSGLGHTSKKKKTINILNQSALLSKHPNMFKVLFQDSHSQVHYIKLYVSKKKCI